MKSIKREIYSATLDSILRDIKLPSSNPLRKAIRNSASKKLTYHQGDKLDHIWEALKISSKYWLSFDLADAFAEFIRNLEPFTIIGHLTFRDQVYLKQAYSYFYRFIRKLNEEFVCRRYRKKKLPGIAWVLVIGKQKRGAFHIHCLLDHPKITDITMARMREVWQSCGAKVGKISQFKRYDPERNMRYYLANHIREGAIIEFSKKLDWQNRSHRGKLDHLSTTHT